MADVFSLGAYMVASFAPPAAEPRPANDRIAQAADSGGATGANVAGDRERGALPPRRQAAEPAPDKPEPVRLPSPPIDLSLASGPPPTFETSVLEADRARNRQPPEPPPIVGDTTVTDTARDAPPEADVPEPDTATEIPAPRPTRSPSSTTYEMDIAAMTATQPSGQIDQMV